jgi:pyruvate/2-oxoglutarate dehydrogenase complex dihydrolipoamide acyltransferase (E2) component
MQIDTLDATAVAGPPAEELTSDIRPVVVSTETRQLAQRLGVDLASLAGSGPDGAITGADVLRAANEVTGLVRPPLVTVEEARDF